MLVQCIHAQAGVGLLTALFGHSAFSRSTLCFLLTTKFVTLRPIPVMALRCLLRQLPCAMLSALKKHIISVSEPVRLDAAGFVSTRQIAECYTRPHPLCSQPSQLPAPCAVGGWCSGCLPGGGAGRGLSTCAARPDRAGCVLGCGGAVSGGAEWRHSWPWARHTAGGHRRSAGVCPQPCLHHEPSVWLPPACIYDHALASLTDDHTMAAPIDAFPCTVPMTPFLYAPCRSLRSQAHMGSSTPAVRQYGMRVAMAMSKVQTPAGPH